MISTNKKIAVGILASATIASLALALPAFAQENENPANQPNQGEGQWQGRGPGMMASSTRMGNRDFRGGMMGSSTRARIGDGFRGPGMMGSTTRNRMMSSTTRNNMMNRDQKPEQSIIKGNGQPVIAGTVASISGFSLSITTSSNTTYSVDGTNAVVSKAGASSTVSAITTGDYVIVQGAVNGNSVTASTIIDQQKRQNGAGDQSANNTTGDTKPAPRKGFFGSIGGFFKGIFGF